MKGDQRDCVRRFHGAPEALAEEGFRYAADSGRAGKREDRIVEFSDDPA